MSTNYYLIPTTLAELIPGRKWLLSWIEPLHIFRTIGGPEGTLYGQIQGMNIKDHFDTALSFGIEQEFPVKCTLPDESTTHTLDRIDDIHDLNRFLDLCDSILDLTIIDEYDDVFTIKRFRDDVLSRCVETSTIYNQFC